MFLVVKLFTHRNCRGHTLKLNLSHMKIEFVTHYNCHSHTVKLNLSHSKIEFVTHENWICHTWKLNLSHIKIKFGTLYHCLGHRYVLSFEQSVRLCRSLARELSLEWFESRPENQQSGNNIKQYPQRNFTRAAAEFHRDAAPVSTNANHVNRAQRRNNVVDKTRELSPYLSQPKFTHPV